ncbi:MAG: amidohydrolase family protein [Phycisphaerales bacterium]|jgi:imidazolonepropionase-like amidohydrolase
MLKASTCAMFAFFALAFPSLAQNSPTAFINAKVIPIAGEEIADGIVIISEGHIVAVGAKGAVKVPANATMIDCAGKVVMPGLVDTHSHIGGIGGADGSAPIQPDVRVMDSVNPFEPGFRRALAGGITTLNVMPGSGHLLSGQTIYLKNRAKVGEAHRIEDLFYWPDPLKPGAGMPLGGIKMANGTNPQGAAPFPGTRGKAAALVREQFIRAQEYDSKIKRANGDEAKLPPRDLGLETLVQAMHGEKIVHHHTHRADDIMTVLRLSKEFGFHVVLHHVSEAWKVAAEIKDSGASCSVIVIDSPGGKLEAAEMTWATGAVLERAGVPVAFHTDDWITDSRLFMRSAAIAVRAGMTRAGALRALTLTGAEELDLAKRVGSLEAGKDADVLVLSGDPLSVYTHVEQTWVEGRKVFDRSDEKDHLWAVGGFGAGSSQTPYLCCVAGAGVGSGEGQ